MSNFRKKILKKKIVKGNIQNRKKKMHTRNREMKDEKNWFIF